MNFGNVKQRKGNLYKSLLPLQALVPTKDSWSEGNVMQKGDGTCEVSINLRFISVNETLVAARKQGVRWKGKWQMMQILILLIKIFPINKISSLEEKQKIP